VPFGPALGSVRQRPDFTPTRWLWFPARQCADADDLLPQDCACTGEPAAVRLDLTATQAWFGVMPEVSWTMSEPSDWRKTVHCWAAPPVQLAITTFAPEVRLAPRSVRHRDGDSREWISPWAMTDQVKPTRPTAPAASATVTVMPSRPSVVGVPEMTPAELMDSPAGRPLAV
jgi:hypothetical protein